MATITTDQAVALYTAWAKALGLDSSHVATLKRYERGTFISRKLANAIADDQYIGGGESDWRQNGYMDAEV